MLSHRDLKDSDIEEICRFPQNAEELFFMFPAANYPLTRQQLSESVRTRQGSTVVLLDGSLAAYGNFFKCVPGVLCDLGNVVVNPLLRRKGVATYLVHIMEQKAVDHFQAKRLKASCFSANTAGLMVYHSLGFEPAGMEIRKNPQGADVVLIHLEKTI